MLTKIISILYICYRVFLFISKRDSNMNSTEEQIPVSTPWYFAIKNFVNSTQTSIWKAFSFFIDKKWEPILAPQWEFEKETASPCTSFSQSLTNLRIEVWKAQVISKRYKTSTDWISRLIENNIKKPIDMLNQLIQRYTGPNDLYTGLQEMNHNIQTVQQKLWLYVWWSNYLQTISTKDLLWKLLRSKEDITIQTAHLSQENTQKVKASLRRLAASQVWYSLPLMWISLIADILNPSTPIFFESAIWLWITLNNLTIALEAIIMSYQKELAIAREESDYLKLTQEALTSGNIDMAFKRFDAEDDQPDNFSAPLQHIAMLNILFGISKYPSIRKRIDSWLQTKLLEYIQTHQHLLKDLHRIKFKTDAIWAYLQLYSTSTSV